MLQSSCGALPDYARHCRYTSPLLHALPPPTEPTLFCAAFFIARFALCDPLDVSAVARYAPRHPTISMPAAHFLGVYILLVHGRIYINDLLLPSVCQVHDLASRFDAGPTTDRSFRATAQRGCPPGTPEHYMLHILEI